MPNVLILFPFRREAMKQTIVSDNKENQRKKKKAKYNCAKKGKRKTKSKSLYNANSDGKCKITML